ncbi:MAG: cysteine-rich CWC family protein [Chloroflexi bacterium]|nr:cysteine-rich CWC family protein [Chloroflexota bacterium]
MNIEEGRSIDTALCPLCGKPNLCPMVANPSATECWCSEEKFPPGLLAQIPENAVRQTCVCFECLKTYRENNSDMDVSS